jgi:uroporphyrinogen decarboxylase
LEEVIMTERKWSHRERVMAALNHVEPDTVPIDMGGIVTSMMKPAYLALKKHLGLEPVDVETFSPDWFTCVDADERVLEYLDIDFRRVYLKGSPEADRTPKPDGTWVDEYGFTRQFTGTYGEMVYHPLMEAKTPKDIMDFKLFDAYAPERVEGLREKALYLYHDTDYAVGAVGITGGIYETACWMRGYDKFPMDCMVEKEMARAMIEKLSNYHVELLDAVLAQVGDCIHMIELTDDLASQNNLLVPPRVYRELIQPAYKKELDFVKSKTNAKLFSHCCGTVVKAAPLLMGAGIDVENEVKRRIAIYGPGGGYICNAAHNIQPDVPPENVVAMYKAARKWGKYPLAKELMELRETIPKKPDFPIDLEELGVTTLTHVS